MKDNVYVTIQLDSELFDLLKKLENKYGSDVDALIEEAVYEYYEDERLELLIRGRV